MIPKLPFPVVGIGASAGGIPAMEALFKGLPARPGMAFVIVTHLNPGRESLLPEVLARFTTLPVVVAKQGTAVKIDHVYVMPQNVLLTIKDRVLQLRPLDLASRERKPIDVFFEALADDLADYAVAVVLSGGDGDGTLGAKAVKERGGFVLAQTVDGSGPRNPDMPRSVIASGVVDVAVSAEAMGERLMDFARGFDLLERLTEVEAGAVHEDIAEARKEIYALLRNRTGHDFAGYKTKTFMRRVRRRMQIAQLTTLADYVDSLDKDPAEIAALFRDLLINVTDFFRDREAFALLEAEVIPRLFKDKSASDSVRVWVPACATGEEVYSLAILLHEHASTLAAPPKVHIFATDIDDDALAIARAARYPESLLEAVSPERRQRFFAADGDNFVLSAEIRELCIFSPHSVIKDPPFSRMDLVSCRNLLIYFGPDIQNRVIPIFHYALRPGGYLFLGTSESIGQHTDLFAAVDKKQRIFRAREPVSAKTQLPVLDTHSDRGLRPVPPFVEARAGSPPASPLRQTVEAHVLERHAPAHVVINADGDILYYSVGTGRYLEAPQGAPSRQLIAMARRGLRIDLRVAISEAIRAGAPVSRENIIVDDEDIGAQLVTVTVEPLPERRASEPLYLVLFQPIGPARDMAGPRDPRGLDAADHLERDLHEVRERLQSTIEEYETALEEAKSANEELISVNEEAQSTNEELEASKEEMQSLNEELNTINTELSGKIDELDRANSDLRNLFESTEIATVFLDRALVIRTFTPAASSFFNLRSSDVGRPLTDLSSQLDYPELRSQIEQVFETGEAIVRQLGRDKANRYYMARLIPYRDKVARINGVVVTFVDVTPLAAAEEHQKVLISELNHRVKNMLAVVSSIVNRSVETAPTKEGFVTALQGRLTAMSRAYGALSRENWAEVSIEELIGLEAAPFDMSRFELSGAPLRLRPQASLSLGMVLHELATNAAKYGALATEGGRVTIEWSVRDDTLELVWRETGGPEAEAPEAPGFGLSLVKGEIEYRLGGSVDARFGAGGFDATITFPLNRKA